MDMWLTEDPELLQVALEIVDTWDGSIVLSSVENLIVCPASVSSTASSDERTPECLSTPGKSSGKRKLYQSTKASTHHRRRLEIVALRRSIFDLEREVKSLEKRKKRHLEETQQYDQSDNQRVQFWREFALRQQHLRTIAESEQQELKQHLHVQRNAIEGLIKRVYCSGEK